MFKKVGEETKQRTKRLWQEGKNTPWLVLDTPSTCTVIGEEPQPNLKLLFTDEQREKRTYLAINLNRLRDKNTRFEFHRDFLLQCVREKFVPKGLELMVEPAIGNHKRKFLDNWYSKLRQFSLSLMEDGLTTQEIAKIKSSPRNKSRNNEKWRIIQEGLETT